MLRHLESRAATSSEAESPTREIDPWSSPVTGSEVAIVAFAARPSLQRWVQEELDGETARSEVVGDASAVIEMLDAEQPPHVCIVDFDELTEGELDRLHTVRAQGWAGIFIALGPITTELRDSLRVRFVITARFGSEWLRKTVEEALTIRVKRRRPPRRA
jgi:hypothetical protein